MHPPLIVDKHPLCGKYMTALMQCHKDHTIAKWWGACNDEHWALTRCLADEKKVVRAERQERAREKFRQQRAETDRRMAEKQQQQQQQQQQQGQQQEQQQQQQQGQQQEQQQQQQQQSGQPQEQQPQ